ncbi:IQ domain-containing protein K [Alligator sinensis]|uniref:IQ domain-containing protein K n=1 Tax=Alligator sinensis TaxID=38654 RepID=A0A3Q0GX72_ALLSI|nr:IQ domain-containing protein K [Alligator sinensis]
MSPTTDGLNYTQPQVKNREKEGLEASAGDAWSKQRQNLYWNVKGCFLLFVFFFVEYEAEQPAFPGLSEAKRDSVSSDTGILQPFSAEEFYSASFDSTVTPKKVFLSTLAPPPEPPDPKTCSPREYLEYYIFPILLPGMAELLHRARKEKCFERKRTKFIACDFLTEWLYNQNTKRKDEPFTEFFSIPFVKDWLKDHPRPPIPLSLLLSEEEASKIIQSFWRGYWVRCNAEVQELRQWQKQLREDKNILKRVQEFWAKQEVRVGSKLEDLEEPTPNHSGISILALSSTPQNTQIMD